MVQGATRTRGLFRTRLALPISLRVITYNLSPSSPNHTGFASATPLFPNVVRALILSTCFSDGIAAGTTAIVLGFPLLEPAARNTFPRRCQLWFAGRDRIDPALASVLKAL